MLTGAAAATGGTASILVPLLLGALLFVVRYVTTPYVLLVPVGAAVALLAAELAADAGGLRSVLLALFLVAGTYPALYWRRESRRATRRLDRLDEILVQARQGRTGEGPAAVEQLADLERALGSVAARVHARGVVLWDVDGYHGTARARAGSHGRPAATLRLSGDPIGWVWEQGMRLRVEPAPRWSRAGLVVVAERLRRDDDHGLIVTYAFEPSDLPSTELVFDEAAVYLRGVLALQESQASAAAGRRRVTALLHGLRRIPGELELDTLAADLCSTAMAITDATGAAVGMWDGEQGEVLAVAGGDGGPAPGDIFVPPASELAIAIRADTMLVRNAAEWSLGRTAVVRPGETWVSRPRALAALPLRGAGGVIGVLAVWSSTARELDGDALELLYALAPYAALHMEHARAFGRMRETAERDPLTLLRNRRSFDEIFTAETVRFERYGRPLSLLVLDLDHFKEVNDRHGHEAGDEVLRRVAQSITSCIRDIDTAARVGGEEFVVLLPETGSMAAVEVAERIRQALARTPIDWRGTAIPVHTSVGVASCPEIVAHPRELVGRADQALYTAKASGRDRVVLASLAADPRAYRPGRGRDLPTDA